MTRGSLRWVPVKTCVRCFKCWRRKTLPMHPDDYKIKPRCTFCTHTCKKHKSARKDCSDCNVVYLKYDTWKNGGGDKRPQCKDDCYHFPHRQGSKYCRFRQNGERRQPGDEDYNDPQMEREQQEFYQGD